MKNAVKIFIEDGRQVVSGLGYFQPNTIKDLREVVKGSAKKFGKATGFKFKDQEGRITGKTYNEFDHDIDCLGTALISLGLKGKNISIISENRYLWGVCFFSIINGTGVAVPLDKYLPEPEVTNLAIRGKVEAVFYSIKYHDMMEKIAQSNKHIKYFICMDCLDRASNKDIRFLELNELLKKGAQLLKNNDRSFIDADINHEEMSVLLFTSGTTSMSKGVMLSHSNIACNVSAITSIIHAGLGDVHLSLLPLHHTFENSIGLIFMIHCGVTIAYCDGIRYIAQNLKEYNVTLLVAVPAIYEAMYKKLLEGIRKKGKEKAYNTMIKLSEILRFLGLDFRRKLFKNVFEQIGPCLRLAVSGAAPLDPKVITGFDKLGLRIIQGYGLTETSPVVAATNEFLDRPGTIGYPLKGIEVSIDNPDSNGMGEIITRGGNVMLGYYEDHETTREVIDDKGWFRTGDIGFIDKQGVITITGRAKSMIVLTNGKKAFPEEYETVLNKIPGISESFVWGNKAPDGDIQVCAKLVLDREAIKAIYPDKETDRELSDIFNAAVREINKTLPQYKIIRYFVLTDAELNKTTKLSTKRSVEYESTMAKLALKGLEMRKASGSFI